MPMVMHMRMDMDMHACTCTRSRLRVEHHRDAEIGVGELEGCLQILRGVLLGHGVDVDEVGAVGLDEV